METEEQAKNRHKADHLAPWQFQPGQSGNPGGRPAGQSMKQFAREYLSSLTREERIEYLKGINKIDVWKMADGNPDTQTDITSGGKPIPIYGGQSVSVPGHDSDEEDISA